MRSAPSPKKKMSPVMWFALIGGLAIGYLALSPSSDTPGGASATRPKKKPTTKAGSLYTEADKTAKFPPLVLAATDAFTPGVKKVVQAIAPPPQAGGVGNIPASMAGGDGNWYFTGIVELNGRREGLLENTTTGETSYVRSGEGWKQARISTVDVSAVVMVGPDGTVARVPLQKYGETAGGAGAAPLASTGPMAVPTGTIGAGVPGGVAVRPVPGTATLRMPDGRTMEVAVDGAGVAGNGQNESRQDRRNRRRDRQNQNQGNPNNG